MQADGSLTPKDFFTPYDVDTLSAQHRDFGSSSGAALPASFGTATHPNLLVTSGGKDGRVYLLDRDKLGGRGQGPNGTNADVAEAGPYDGVWGHPAVWGGDGGWVYMVTVGPLRAYQYSVDATGTPQLTLAGVSADTFGFGSGSPVVSSNGSTSGSALVWAVYEPDATGVGAELRAYDPVPVGFSMKLRWKAAIGQASKFSVPALDIGDWTKQGPRRVGDFRFESEGAKLGVC